MISMTLTKSLHYSGLAGTRTPRVSRHSKTGENKKRKTITAKHEVEAYIHDAKKKARGNDWNPLIDFAMVER